MALGFDNNRIVIRERNMLEIMDLALMVLREYGTRLWVALGVGMVPLLVLNTLLIARFAALPYVEMEEVPGRYLALLYLLVSLELPLATAGGTLYLKEAMFQERPQWNRIWSDFRESCGQLFYYQILLRGLFILPAVWSVWTENYGLVFFLWILALVPFVRHPYLNEIILLERNPRRAGNSKRLTTSQRATRVHERSASELIGRWLGALFVGGLLLLAVWLALWVVASQLAGQWQSQYVAVVYFLPFSLWLVVGFFTVVRFLCYLDSRIRREGWEVELALRAEGARLAGHAT